VKRQLTPADVKSVDDVLHETVTARNVEHLTPGRAHALSSPPYGLVIAATADEEALALLRAAKQSYHVTSTSETYLAPRDDHVMRGVPSQVAGSFPQPRMTSPFARRASRVSRYLLLHPREAFPINELAHAVDLDKSVVSRTVSTLGDEGLVDVARDPADARLKLVSVTNPLRLLEEWRLALRRTRPRAQRFDIGTRTADATLRAISDAQDQQTPWAISGVAGAAFVRRAVEPADVLLLTNQEGMRNWAERLLAEPRADRGLLRMAAVPDEFIFRFARRQNGLVIADPVQLWLDTASAGERAAQASEAIARDMGW